MNATNGKEHRRRPKTYRSIGNETELAITETKLADLQSGRKSRQLSISVNRKRQVTGEIKSKTIQKNVFDHHGTSLSQRLATQRLISQALLVRSAIWDSFFAIMCL